MSRINYTPEFKAKIVIEVLQGDLELSEIAAKNNLNPNMVRRWKKEFYTVPSAVVETHKGHYIH